MGHFDRQIDRRGLRNTERSPNHCVTPEVRCDRLRRERDGLPVARTLAITAHAIRAISLASAIAATLAGRGVSTPISQSRCHVRWIWQSDHSDCACREEAANCALLANTAKRVLPRSGSASARAQSKPRGPVPVGRRLAARDQRCCQHRPDVGDSVQPFARHA